MDTQTSGIYCIVNLVNNKFYVGSAMSLRTRKGQHFRLLAHGKHHSRRLQFAWNKYGKEAFEFRIIANGIAKDDLVPSEQFWMDKLQPEYNMTTTAGNVAGHTVSVETRARLSAMNKGKRLSPEACAKISAIHKGVPKSKEHAAKVGLSQRGSIRSPEVRERISNTKLLAATHCKRGHQLTSENSLFSTRKTGRVKRNCRACTQLRVRTKRQE